MRVDFSVFMVLTTDETEAQSQASKQVTSTVRGRLYPSDPSDVSSPSPSFPVLL